MNILIELFFIFLFLYAIIIFKFPDLDSHLLSSDESSGSGEDTDKNDNYLWQKFVLFVSIFCFYFILQMIGKITSNCTINISEILGNCYVVAVSGILGYTVFVDLGNMTWSSENMNEFIISLDGNRYMFTLIVTLFIVMFITVVKMLGLMVSYNDQEMCNK